MPPLIALPSDSPSTTIANPSRHPCVTCQRRKVKCDRRAPCTRCLTYGHECTQPEFSHEPRRTARRSQDLVSRVRQLEDALEEVRAQLNSQTASNEENSFEAPPGGSARIKGETSSIDDLLGHLIIDEDKSRYISTSSWANFAWEASDLGTFLTEASARDADRGEGSSGMIYSGLFGSQSRRIGPPPPIGLDILWPVYVRNVDPMLKILHIPTVQPVIDSAIAGYNQTNEGFECLFAAIKFAAITSLRDHECWEYGSSRQTLLSIFRGEVQETLSNAHFLTSENFVTLQAFVIFLICSRRCEQPRTMWMLSGNAMRMASSLGLHRDGSVLKLSVFVTELRRRLWWCICELDTLVAEECGFSPTRVDKADVKFPLNINDSDIYPTIEDAPKERAEFTELTWQLIRFELCQKLQEFHSHGNRKTMGDLTGSRQDVLSQCLLLRECKQILESKYFKHCSSSIPLQWMALKLGHRVILKLSLVIQCPLFHINGHKSSDHLSLAMIDQLAAISCEIIESQHQAIIDPQTAGWSWILQTHIHWHPVAYLLNLICCSNKPIDQLQRAWTAVNYAFEDCLGLTEVDHRAIWKPLESLVVKCRAKMQDLGSGTGSSGSSPNITEAYSGLSETILFGDSALATSAMLSSTTQMQNSGREDAMDQNDQVNRMIATDEYFSLLDAHTLFEIHQPFMTMDDFMTMNEGWWNEDS